MTDSEQHTEKIFCNTCKTLSNHVLRARYTLRRHDDWDDDESVTHLYRYSLWSCAGCDEATLQCQLASEDYEEEWADMGAYYPPRQRDSINPKIFRNLNRELKRLYSEVVTSFNQDCLLLCTVGLRALVEGICADKGITEGNLERKIDGLHKILPSLNLIEALHTFRVTGNYAAHRLEALDADDARAAIDVVEDILNFLYDLDYKASQVRKRGMTQPAKPGAVH